MAILDGATRQLNLLCVGDITAGKSTFLASYTRQPSEQGRYKVYMRKAGEVVVYLHEVEEREGAEVYYKYPFDAVLYFVRGADCGNPNPRILEKLATISSQSGVNVYAIPLRVVVLGQMQEEEHYSPLPYLEQHRLASILNKIIAARQLVVVDGTPTHEKALNSYYREVLGGEGRGVKESLVNSWWLGGRLLPIGQIQLSVVRAWQEVVARVRWNWKDIEQRMPQKKLF